MFALIKYFSQYISAHTHAHKHYSPLWPTVSALFGTVPSFISLLSETIVGFSSGIHKYMYNVQLYMCIAYCTYSILCLTGCGFMLFFICTGRARVRRINYLSVDQNKLERRDGCVARMTFTCLCFFFAYPYETKATSPSRGLYAHKREEL